MATAQNALGHPVEHGEHALHLGPDAAPHFRNDRSSGLLPGEGEAVC
jgi:dihydroorotase